MTQDETIVAEILRQTAACAPGASVGPGDIAQALHHEWRSLLGAVRKQAVKLAEAGQIEILRKGKPIPPAEMRGVIRLRRAAAPETC
jgi:hypothetical protein